MTLVLSFYLVGLKGEMAFRRAWRRVAWPGISRAQVSFEDGTVTISADVWHRFGVREARPEVTRPDGTKETVPVTPAQRTSIRELESPVQYELPR